MHVCKLSPPLLQYSSTKDCSTRANRGRRDGRGKGVGEICRIFTTQFPYEFGKNEEVSVPHVLLLDNIIL